MIQKGSEQRFIRVGAPQQRPVCDNVCSQRRVRKVALVGVGASGRGMVVGGGEYAAGVSLAVGEGEVGWRGG